MLRKYPRIFQDPHTNYPVCDSRFPFTHYIRESEKIIASTRQDLNIHPEITIQYNAPFELWPQHSKPTCGVLLIHGLLDSAFIMRDIGYDLQSQGALVRSILLPGHGTVPGALLNVTYNEWLQTVKYGVETLKQDVEKVFIVGFSTGASLAMLHAAEDPDIGGLILLAPALKINSPFTFLSQWMRAQWFSLSEEIDYVKYQSIPFNAIYQVYQLGLMIEKFGVEKLSHCPLLMILSQEDKVICSRTALNYFQKTTHPLNRLLLYSDKPVKMADHRIQVKNSRYPEKNILNFCHISLPVTPKNSHYGQNGDYLYASHIKKNIKYGAFDKIDIGFYNTLQRLHLSSFQYQRLTFNPDFEFMCQKTNDFIFS